MNRWIAVAVAILGVGLIGYAIFSSQSDEEKIIARLEQLEDAVRLDEQSSNPVIRLSRVNGEFAEIFTDDVTYRISELTSAKRSRKTLAGLAAKAGSYASTFDVDFKDIDVRITDSGTGATVDSTADLRATRRGGRYEHDERRVRFEFVDTDDGWQIAHFRVSRADE